MLDDAGRAVTPDGEGQEEEDEEEHREWEQMVEGETCKGFGGCCCCCS